MKKNLQASLNEIFQRIPLLADHQAELFEITELKGYSNNNYRIKNHNLDLILRLPRNETSQYINRARETYNEKIAFTLGLTTNCLWQNERGESLRQVIPQSRTLTAENLRNYDIIDLLVEKLLLLHNSPQTFQGQVNVQVLIDRYSALLNKQQQKKLKPRILQTKKILQTLTRDQAMTVPSHNDLNENNLLLDNNNKLWLIDWEYSSMASPYWDLATICNAGNYQQSHNRYLLDRYNQQHPCLNLDTLNVYREALSLLNDCWMTAFTRKS